MSGLGTLFDQSKVFAHQRVHLAVCGSVSCYRALDLLRAWKKLDVHISVTLTRGAQRFVQPLLFEALGALPVYTEMFQEGDCFAHLEPGQHCQAMVIAPASADAIARLANGAASDLLSAQALAFDGQLLLAPAMNPRMWKHPALQENLRKLESYGAKIVLPDQGQTACGDEGQGRLAKLSEIFLHSLRCLAPQDLRGLHVLVTLGPTREFWDRVRFWSNPSSGRMGGSLALSAWLRGAQVTALCGAGVADFLPADVKRIDVQNAQEMLQAARDLWSSADLGIFSAAVADFAPVAPEQGFENKFKKADAPQGLTVNFTPNPDILQTLSNQRRTGQKILAFAAETCKDMDSLLPLARLKLVRKKADLVAANRVNSPDSGFGVQTNSLAVVDIHGREEIWPVRNKSDLAWDLCTWLLRI